MGGGKQVTPLQITMVGTGLLIFKWFFTISIQSFTAFAAGTKPPEDEELMPQWGPQDFEGKAIVKDKRSLSRDEEIKREVGLRWRRIVQNDLESIPLGVAMAWGTLLCHYSQTAHAIFVTTFSVGRVFHTYFFATRRQPGRALAWSAATVSLLGLTVNGLLGALVKNRARPLLLSSS